MPVAFGNSLRSATSSAPEPGTNIENAQLFHAQAITDDKIQRAFDHGFSLRSWHQNVRRYRKRKTPEFLSSKNARYRLALQSARGKS